MKNVNFDANATYGLLPAVEGELREVLGDLGAGKLLNPSSTHQGGQRAKIIIEDARAAVRTLVGASEEDEIVFTSGATEGNNWIVSAQFLESTQNKNNSEYQAVASAVEHPSVLEPLDRVGRMGYAVKLVAPTGSDNWDSLPIADFIMGSTKLFSCMTANNETGELLPISDFAKIARSRNPEILIHTDAVQAAGKVPLHFDTLGVDAMTISAHKLGGLIGCGAVVLRAHTKVPSFILGGAQEMRHRAGTENVLGIASLGIAAKLAHENLQSRLAAMERNRKIVREILLTSIPSARIIRECELRLPNTLCVQIPGRRADDLVVAADLRGVAISSGAACASGKQLPSHVLLAYGLSEAEARQCIRISVQAESTSAEVEAAAKQILAAILESGEGAWNAFQ